MAEAAVETGTAHDPVPAAAQSSVPHDPDDDTLAVLGWGALGVGVAAAAGAVAAWRVREGHAARWNDDSRCLVPGTGTREEQCAGEREAVSTAETWSVALLSLAGGAVVASALLLIIGGQSDPEERARTKPLGCSGGPGEAGVACEVRF